MSKTITKYLLALCLICNVANAFAQHRYYCEVKGIEKGVSSGLKIIDKAREGIMTKTEYQRLKK